MPRPILLLSLLLAAGLGHAAPDPGPGAAQGDPAWAGPPRSVTPNLATGADGRLIVTWLEPMGPSPSARYALRFAVRHRGRWSPPATIHESDRFFVNWADFASLTETGDGRWVAHWPEKTAPATYAYHVMIAVSADQGRTWSPPRRVHDDSSATEHGFVAMAPSATGVDLAWLDGRAMQGGERGEMSVRTRTLLADGRWGPEVALDTRTCECCQVTMTRTPDGLVVAYRDRSPGEVRDIAVVREGNGRWSEPRVVAADGWEHRACPVNGPALVSQGQRVDLVWFTGVGGANRVWLARSTDGGATFGSRIRIDEGETLGRVDAEPLGDGSVLVVWLEGRSAEQAEWRVRRVAADGRAGPSRVVATVPRARLAGFPRLARTAEGVWLAYTATGPDGGVRVVRIGG